MLDRWNTEDVSKEPEWSIEDLEPMTNEKHFQGIVDALPWENVLLLREGE